MNIEADHTSDPDNIILTLHGLNGRTVKIAVPKEHGRNDWVWSEGENQPPFGLNLVYNPSGYHYE